MIINKIRIRLVMGRITYIMYTSIQGSGRTCWAVLYAPQYLDIQLLLLLFREHNFSRRFAHSLDFMDSKNYIHGRLDVYKRFKVSRSRLMMVFFGYKK